ncbi:MAG: hypothetical protein ACOY93_01115 [Bacillota bacterium]
MDAAQGYIELGLFGPRPLDLGGWSIAGGGGEFRLPAGTTLTPGQPLLLVRSAAAFRERFGPYPYLLELPGLTLSPERDRAELRNGPELVDRVAWGGALPGWTLSGRRTLCRNPAGQDTNSYLDWTLWSAPSPGAAGCGR